MVFRPKGRRRQIGLQPVIMVRGEDGAIRVLFNRCRHRANMLCHVDRGNAESFTCPYHGWSYANTGELIASGSPEEIEIRALAVHAVERLVAALADRGVRSSARELDQLLWMQGQDPEIKAHPRHRTRTVYY